MLGIDFISSQEALDTTTPMGKAMFTIIGAMAELERNVIRERGVAGMEYARRHGTKSVVLGDATVLIGIGGGIGIGLAVLLTKPLSTFLSEGVTAADPATLVPVVLVLAITGVAAAAVRRFGRCGWIRSLRLHTYTMRTRPGFSRC